jgi:hypothetical protein
MADHDRAVRALVEGTQRARDVDTTRAHGVQGYPSPSAVRGEVPDIVFVLTTGHTLLVEVDTRPMSDREERQSETFRTVAEERTATSYEHYFAGDVL